MDTSAEVTINDRKKARDGREASVKGDANERNGDQQLTTEKKRRMEKMRRAKEAAVGKHAAGGGEGLFTPGGQGLVRIPREQQLRSRHFLSETLHVVPFI